MRASALSRKALTVASAATLSVAGLVVAAPSVQASTEVFDSTNTTSYANTSSDTGLWHAFKFSASTDTSVSRIDVYTATTSGSDIYVSVTSNASSGVLATFTLDSTETGLKCNGRDCERLTFTGSVNLTAGNDYWLRIGSLGGSTVNLDWFKGGASATVGGLPLGHTFGTNDIADAFGATYSSVTDGYPWIKMFTSTSSSSSATSRSPVPEFTIALPTNDGAQCTQGDVSAPRGVWVELPTAADCSPPAALPDSTLLGWATQEDFPVAIAQRQIDNGWGAYETFDNDGRLTGVFIPAGGYTLVTNDTNLYPIWSE